MSPTIIYVDGYNLYYSRLKGTPYKWLDLGTLFRDQILKPQDPSANVICIKYFTSPVKASYARHGEASAHAQTQYHRALKATHGELVQIYRASLAFGSIGCTKCTSRSCRASSRKGVNRRCCFKQAIDQKS